MEQDNMTAQAPHRAAPELVRPREGRMIAGVAAALAHRFDVSVVLVRAIFVLLTFAGGTGLALYAVGWFLIRSQGEALSPARQLFSGAADARSWIGLGLVFIAILVLLDNFTFFSGGVIWAVALLVVGFLLYTGDLQRFVERTESTGNEPPPGGGAPPTGEAMQLAEAPGSVTSPTDAGTAVEDVPAGGAPPPPPPPTPTPTPPILPPRASGPRERSVLGRITIGVMLVALGVLAILDNITILALEPQPRHYMALAVTVLGLGLIVGGFIGRARWLILIAVIMVPTLLFSPVFEYDWDNETFDRTYAPGSFDDLESSYGLEVGSLVIDLTHLPWDGEAVQLTAEVDAGNIQIILPPDVGVTGRASVDVGRVSGLGRHSAGLGNPTVEFDEPGTAGLVELDAEVDAGNIDVMRIDERMAP